MQNLSLKMSQTTLAKKPDESLSKNTSAPDLTNTAEKNASFQHILNKQVQSQQQTSTQKTAGQVMPAEQESVIPIAKEQFIIDAKNPDFITNSKADSFSFMLNNRQEVNQKQEGPDVDLISTLNTTFVDKVDSTRVPFTHKRDPKLELDDSVIDVKAKIADESTNNSLVAPVVLAPMVNSVPLVQPTVSAALEADVSKNTTPTESMQKQRNIDSVLQKSTVQTTVIDTQDGVEVTTQLMADAKVTAEQPRWLDKVLQGLDKPFNGDVAKDSLIKEKLSLETNTANVGLKELTMPVNYPNKETLSSLQSNSVLGSANYIDAYPGKTGWDQAINQKVVWMVGSGEQSATLTLNPPELGPLQVVIHVNNDKADTTFISENSEVRRALEDGMANLRDQMSQSGIALGQTNVSTSEQSKQQFEQMLPSRKVPQLNDAAMTTSAEKMASASPLVRVSNGLVDTFV